MSKSFTKTLKSSKSLDVTYAACKKTCIDGKLNIVENELTETGFTLKAKEPMKWLTTNWPNSIHIKCEVFNDALMVRLEASSKGTGFTQEGNINAFLSNIADSMNAYIS